MKASKRIALAVFSAFTFSLCAGICMPTQSDARVHIKTKEEREHKTKNTYTINEAQAKDASYLAKRTSLDEQTVYRYFQEGLNKEDIKICWLMSQMSGTSMDEVIEAYNEDNKMSLLAKDFDVSMDDFKKRYDEVFPAWDETNFQYTIRKDSDTRISPYHGGDDDFIEKGED